MLRLEHILVIAALNNTLHAAISDQYNAHYSNFMTYDTKNDVLTLLSCDSIKIKRSQLNQTVRWDKDGDQIVLVKLLENPVYNDDGKYVAKLSVNEKCYTLEVKYVRKKDLTAKYALAYRLQNNENDQEFFYPGSGPIFRQSDFDREPWICNKASCIFERHVLHVSNNVEFKVLVNEKHYPMEVISNQVETNGIALHNSRITVHLRGTCSNRSIIVSYVSNDREWMIYRGEVPITGCSGKCHFVPRYYYE